MEPPKLYDTSVVIELLARNKVRRLDGLITIYTVIEYPPSLLRAVEVLYPDKDDYELAIKWQSKLRKIGNPLPAVDLIIAAIADNRGLKLVTKDRHFKYIKDIAPKLNLELL